MAQQTAVEWLVEQLVELDKELDGRRKSDDSTVIKINPTKIYKQAKQMEKEQIINFHGWMLRNDTQENAELFFHYGDMDMVSLFFENNGEDV